MTTKTIAALVPAIGVAIALTATTPGTAIAAFETGNMLHNSCISFGRECFGYVEGVLDAAIEFNSSRWCLPNNFVLGQAVDVTIKYLRDNPEERHLLAAGLVARAMAKAWPCPQPH